MATRHRLRRERILAAACSGLGVLVTCCASRADMARPPPIAACRAWNHHFAELIDRHRVAQELDEDRLGEVIRLFYEAQSACSAARFEEGLRIYEAIPLGPIRTRKLQ
ncbi:MAG TPA: hypothetical protein VEZ16_06930 [Microvirga sp.]|nr:hypothetical protein [Microvirga sp.]